MKKSILIAALVVTFISFDAIAECSSPEIRNMINQGMTDDDIDKKCNNTSAYPQWLSGAWEYDGSFTEGCGPMGAGCTRFFGFYQFKVDGNSFNVYKIHDDYLLGTGVEMRLNRVDVLDAGLRNNTLTFTIGDGGYNDSSTTYKLRVLSEKKLQGEISSYWNPGFGLPPGNLVGQLTFRKVQ